MQQPALGRVRRSSVVAQRGEHVVHEPAAFVDVPRILRRHPRQTASLLGEIAIEARGGERRLVAAGVVELHFDR